MSDYVLEVLNKLVLMFPAFLLGICIAKGADDD